MARLTKLQCFRMGVKARLTAASEHPTLTAFEDVIVTGCFHTGETLPGGSTSYAVQSIRLYREVYERVKTMSEKET